MLDAVRERVRCKEVWGSGADRYRNPDDDLPADFAVRRDACYQELGQPVEADTFIDSLQREMTDALAMLDPDCLRIRRFDSCCAATASMPSGSRR